MARMLARTLDGLEWLATRIIIVTFAVMVLAILATVVTRNISVSITWFEELSRFMQIWFVSLGFAVALRRGFLSGAEMALAVLPERLASAIVLLAKLIILGVALMVLISGTDLLAHLSRSGQEAAALRIPMVWVYVGLWLGFALTVVFTAGSLILQAMGHRDRFARSFAATIAPPADIDADARAILAETEAR